MEGIEEDIMNLDSSFHVFEFVLKLFKNVCPQIVQVAKLLTCFVVFSDNIALVECRQVLNRYFLCFHHDNKKSESIYRIRFIKLFLFDNIIGHILDILSNDDSWELKLLQNMQQSIRIAPVYFQS